MAALAGRSPRTPIGMKELWDEVQNLKATAKSWEIVELVLTSRRTFPFDSKFSSYKFSVLKFNAGYDTDTGSINISVDNNVFKPQCFNAGETGNITFTKSGNNIIANQDYLYPNSGRRSITVLFYK